MKVELKNQENNVVLMEIEIPADEAQKEYDKTVSKISQYASVPGFRKGKAPKNIIERQYGVDAIKYEALENMLPRVLSKAIEDNKLDVLTHPTVESYDYNLGEDLKLTAKVELKPEVELGEYKNISLDVEQYQQPEDAFDKSLNAFLERQAIMQDITDRKIEGNDICTIDFDGYVDGEKIQGGEGKNYALDIAHSTFIPGFAEALVGHELNEEFDINVTFPEEYHEKKLAGKPAVFKIKVNKIQIKVLPELNDELAKKVGPFNSVDELKADIQKYLDQTKQREDDARIKKAVFEKVLEGVKVDIQESMVEREAQELLNEYKQRLSAQGFNYEDVLKSQDQDKLMTEIKEDARLRLKSSLVVDKIAKVENLTIETQDFDSKLAQVQSMYRLDKNTMLNELKSNPSILTNISQQILSEKVINFLVENNKINLK